MCNSYCIITSLTTNNFTKYSLVLNVIIIILNIIIIFISILCLISCEIDLIIKTGYMNYTNNILLCILFILGLLLIEFYRKKNYLLKDKKQISIIIIMVSLIMSVLKCFSSLIALAKIKRIYESIKIQSNYKNDRYEKLYKQVNLLLGYILTLFGLFIILSIFLIIYTLLIYNLRIIIFNNDVNNVYNNRNNISYLSTQPDISDNSNEIIINNINERNKNNNFYYLSKNIINKVEKDYEDKESQTIIKGII